MSKRWKVLVEHEYDQADLADPRVDDHIWLKESAGRPYLESGGGGHPAPRVRVRKQLVKAGVSLNGGSTCPGKTLDREG